MQPSVGFRAMSISLSMGCLYPCILGCGSAHWLRAQTIGLNSIPTNFVVLSNQTDIEVPKIECKPKKEDKATSNTVNIWCVSKWLMLWECKSKARLKDVGCWMALRPSPGAFRGHQEAVCSQHREEKHLKGRLHRHVRPGHQGHCATHHWLPTWKEIG